MSFTSDERKVLATFVKQHLKEIRMDETLMNQPPIVLGAEVKYDEFLTELLKKLE